MNKLRILGILTLAVAFGFAGAADATLTFDGASVTGTGSVTVDGISTSNYAIGPSTTSGTIAIGGTAQTGAITSGILLPRQSLRYLSGEAMVSRQ